MVHRALWIELLFIDLSGVIISMNKLLIQCLPHLIANKRGRQISASTGNLQCSMR